MSKFKKLMKEQRVSQNTLATQLNVHQTLISQWCNGKGAPSIYHIPVVAKVLNVSVERIIECFPMSERK